MSITHHNLDVHPVPRETTPLFINEPWLIDKTHAFCCGVHVNEPANPEGEPDNIRIYVPLDLNAEAILRRLDYIIAKYEEASDANEFHFSSEAYALVNQIEIYNQIWSVRNMESTDKCSENAKSLVEKFVEKLEAIPDVCAECFPFELIDELREDYL